MDDMATQVAVSELELTVQQQKEVRKELAAILAHPSFRSSDRCSRLLRYVVESALTTHQHRLKERTIGHEVFGRPLSYETSSDPVVRNAASEMRRCRFCLRVFASRCSNLIRSAATGSRLFAGMRGARFV